MLENGLPALVAIILGLLILRLLWRLTTALVRVAILAVITLLAWRFLAPILQGLR